MANENQAANANANAADAMNPSNFANGPTSASGRIKVADKDYDETTGTFSIVFSNGKSAEITLDSLPGNIQKMLALHGLSQKLGDSYASVKGNVEEAMQRFEAVVTQLQSGEWRKTRAEGNNEGSGKVTELAAAIARFRDAPIEKANAVVAKASPEQKKAWQANAQIKAIIATIRAEKAAERAKSALATADANPDAAAAADADISAIDLG